MMLNFGAAASHLEFGPNKNISFTCQAMRPGPIDLWEFPICQRQAAYQELSVGLASLALCPLVETTNPLMKTWET